ncbi:MAG: hypothetical protein FWD53_01785 [Phycisphaerales bacterium]|nr:hypothetical protein [Phycisphaerales bacterium]
MSQMSLQIRGLGKRKLSELQLAAKLWGMSTERYVKHLIDESLEISREARTKTFREIIGPSQEVDEVELDQIVDRARTEFHKRQTQRQRKAR